MAKTARRALGRGRLAVLRHLRLRRPAAAARLRPARPRGRQAPRWRRSGASRRSPRRPAATRRDVLPRRRSGSPALGSSPCPSWGVERWRSRRSRDRYHRPPGGSTRATEAPAGPFRNDAARPDARADLHARGHASPATRCPRARWRPTSPISSSTTSCMLDGNARLNLATFVTTWMEPQAEAPDGGVLRQEHDRQGRVPADRGARDALREHPRRPLARARRRRGDRLLDDRLERGGDARRAGAQAALAAARARPTGKPADKPNIVMGVNVQICWEKFANYWDVEMRLVPMEGDRFTLSPEEAVKRCDENTIGVVGDPRLDLRRRVRAGRRDLRRARRAPGGDRARRAGARRRRLGRVRRPVRRPRPRVGLPAAAGGVDQRLRHKYGLVYPGVGWVVWRDADALPEDLIFWVNYLGDNMPTFALNFSRPGAQVVAQYYNFLRLGFDGLPARCSRLCARRRDEAVGADRRAGAVRADHPRRPAAGVRVQAQGRRRQLHGVRRVERAARARLAGARPTPSRRTAPTSRRCAWSSGTGSATTSATC